MCRTLLKDEMEHVGVTRDKTMKTKYIAELEDLIFIQPLFLCNSSFKEDLGIIFDVNSATNIYHHADKNHRPNL